jgi:hypothetical protein
MENWLNMTFNIELWRQAKTIFERDRTRSVKMNTCREHVIAGVINASRGCLKGMRRRNVKACFFLALVVILSTSFGRVAAAWSGTYHLPNESVKIWTNRDGSIDLLYNVTLSLDSGENMSFVTVGQPKGNYTIGSAADQYGNVLSATDASEGSDYKVKVVLNTSLIAGQTLWFTLTTNVAEMMYYDTMNPGNLGMQFIPCWWPVNVDDLQVTIVMPSWVGFNSSLFKVSPSWNNMFTEDSRLAIFWEKQNLLPNEQFPIIVSFLGPNPPNAQTGEVVMYEPTDDTYVDSSNQNSNYGERDHLEISTWTNSSQTNEKIVWLRFSLYELPDGAIIDGATLQLYTSVVNETYSVQAYYCHDNSWSELTLTYGNMPGYNATSIDSVLVTNDNQWYNWSVVDAIRNALNTGSKAVTIILRETSPHNPASEVWFDSKEYPTYPPYQYAPKLTMDYSGIVQVGVSSSKTVVGQTYDCPVNVTLSISGDFHETFNITVYANMTVIATQTVNNILNGTPTVLASIWNTAGIAYGNYTISAHATPSSGETNTTDNYISGGWVVITIPGDLNGDFKVGISDLVILAKTYDSTSSDFKWNPNADIDGNGRASLTDLVIFAQHYGQRCP